VRFGAIFFFAASVGRNLYFMRLPGLFDFRPWFSFGRMDVQTIIDGYCRIPCVAGVPAGWPPDVPAIAWPKIN
jgi:hypothetical protein